MTITVHGPKEAWKSPDGKITIYEFRDQDNNQWSTFSHRLGKGEGQSFDVEVYQKNGKTYVRPPQDPNSPYAKSGASPVQAALPDDSFKKNLDRLEELVSRLEMLYTAPSAHPVSPQASAPTSTDIDDFLG